MRSTVRAKYGLPAAPCGDCCMHFCCHCFSTCQELREVKAREAKGSSPSTHPPSPSKTEPLAQHSPQPAIYAAPPPGGQNFAPHAPAQQHMPNYGQPSYGGPPPHSNHHPGYPSGPPPPPPQHGYPPM